MSKKNSEEQYIWEEGAIPQNISNVLKSEYI